MDSSDSTHTDERLQTDSTLEVAESPLVVAGYQLLDEVGRGASGIVYRALQPGLNRIVALKMLIGGSQASDAQRARLRAEAESVARLQHPEIVQIFAIHEDWESPFLVLEYVEGADLKQRIRGGPVSPRVAAQVVRRVALAVDYAHQNGVIHRDLKPANILVGGADEVPLDEVTLKLTDFGLAKQLETRSDLTQTGALVGTPAYMAPEQALNEDGGQIGQAVDIYGLGVILYELVTGAVPFLEDSPLETLMRVVNDMPAAPSSLHSEIPAELDRICLKCLAKSPANRYSSAEALAEDLDSLCGNESTATVIRAQAQQNSARPESLSDVSATSLPRPKNPPRLLKPGIALLLLLALAAAFWLFRGELEPRSPSQPATSGTTAPAALLPEGPPIKVGVLHSLTGSDFVAGCDIVDATMLAISEINAAGGLLGRRVESVMADGRSDPQDFAAGAKQLLAKDDVCVIFGCSTTIEREAVEPLVESANNLLIFPADSAGLTISPNVLYVGAAPNQQILPAVTWCANALDKRRFYFIGTDDFFSHAALAIIQDQASSLGGAVVGNSFIGMGGSVGEDDVRRILAANPDVIINGIFGDSSNDSLFDALTAAAVKPEEIPTVSFHVSELELQHSDIQEITGNYAVSTYFDSLDLPANQRFIDAVHKRFGPAQVVNDTMVNAYVGVMLWAQAVEEAGTSDVLAVRMAIRHQRYEGPGGLVRVSPDLFYTSKTARIGKVDSNKQFEIIWSSDGPIAPMPYPPSRTRTAWKRLLETLLARSTSQPDTPATTNQHEGH